MASDQSTRSVSLGTHSARGLVYLFASSSAAKVVSFGGQIALAWLLFDKDYGVFALATIFASVIQVIELAGVGDLLVRRKNFLRWALPGFWLALALGIVSCSLVLLAAPLSTFIYDNEQLRKAILILAPSSLANALSVVPRAQLAQQLRFRALAVVNFINVTLRMCLMIALAVAKFGPFSLIVPIPISSALTAALLWWWVRPAWSPHLHFRRWRYMIGDSTQLLLADLARALHDQSDYIVIGLFQTVAFLGVYKFGFDFSVQMIQLVAVNLMNILYPALNKLNAQPQNQFQAFLKSQRILALLGIFACFLQAATAKPLTLMFLPPRWEASIGVMQILSLGMATRMLSASAFALLKSQGRFRTALVIRYLILVVQFAALFLVMAFDGSVNAVALAVAIVGSVISPLTLRAAVEPYGAAWREVLDILLRPLVCGGLAVGTAWAIAVAMDHAHLPNWAQLLEILVVASALNALLARIWMRPVWDDLWARAMRLLPARFAA